MPRPPLQTRQQRKRLASLRQTDPEIEPRAIAEIDLDVLRENYHAILKQVPSQFILPMVKANAYGHGAYDVVQALKTQPTLFGFGVASLEEGKEVREAMGMGRLNSSFRVLVFSGTAPWSEEKGEYCELHSLTPVIVSDDDWKKFVKGGWQKRIPYHLKFNTGMNRLGISFHQKKPILAQLLRFPEAERPEGICTHFAVAEDPKSPLTRQQVERFREIQQEYRKVLEPAPLFHCANSAAIWNAKLLGIEDLGEIVRPGLSLYGVTPWKGAPLRGIAPALQLGYTIGVKHLLKTGERVGYGGTYKVSTASQWIGILTAGYGDGALRTLSGKGELWLEGRARRIAGRVSMDLLAIECDASTPVGTRAYLLGAGIDPWTQAEAAGTIPYELLTSISPRVKRVYVPD